MIKIVPNALKFEVTKLSLLWSCLIVTFMKLPNCHLCIYIPGCHFFVVAKSSFLWSNHISLPNCLFFVITKLLFTNCHYFVVTNFLLPICHLYVLTKLLPYQDGITKLSLPKIFPSFLNITIFSSFCNNSNSNTL